MTCCWSHLHAVIYAEWCGWYLASQWYIIPSFLIPRYFSDTSIPRIPSSECQNYDFFTRQKSILLFSYTKWLCPWNFWGHSQFKKVCPQKIWGRNSRFSYAPEKYIFFAKFSAMPPKDLAHFHIYIPHKKPSFNDKVRTIDFLSLVFWAEYSYISKRIVQLLGSAKNWPTHEACYAPPWKIFFINVVQPFYGCQRNARKNIMVIVSVRVSVMVRVSLVWFVSGNNLVA